MTCTSTTLHGALPRVAMMMMMMMMAAGVLLKMLLPVLEPQLHMPRHKPTHWPLLWHKWMVTPLVATPAMAVLVLVISKKRLSWGQ